MPALYTMGCSLLYLNQRRTIAAVIAAGGSDERAYTTATVQFKSNLLFGVFLLYPTLTATLFRVPQCRDMTDQHSVHEEDFSIDCHSGSYMVTVAVTGLLIILVPVGVPSTFLVLMRRAKDLLGGTPNLTALGGAKLVPDEVEDGDDPFGFLCSDCKPEYYYYEIVTYMRKLLLGGLTIFLGRGSLAQASRVCFHSTAGSTT